MNKEISSSIQGIILDMDGVLCDSEPLICEAACRMFQERHQVQVQPEDFKPFVGTGENSYLSGVAGKYHISLALESDKAQTYAIYLELIKGRLQPLPGAADFVDRCRRCELKVAVATSADLIKLEGNLDAIHLPVQTFNATVTGSEVERKKPHPDLFLMAARRLHLSPEHCLVIEDAPNGIEAATRAGMAALGLTTSFSADILLRAGARETAPDLAHVPLPPFLSHP